MYRDPNNPSDIDFQDGKGNSCKGDSALAHTIVRTMNNVCSTKHTIQHCEMMSSLHDILQNHGITMDRVSSVNFTNLSQDDILVL